MHQQWCQLRKSNSTSCTVAITKDAVAFLIHLLTSFLVPSLVQTVYGELVCSSQIYSVHTSLHIVHLKTIEGMHWSMAFSCRSHSKSAPWRSHVGHIYIIWGLWVQCVKLFLIKKPRWWSCYCARSCIYYTLYIWANVIKIQLWHFWMQPVKLSL